MTYDGWRVSRLVWFATVVWMLFGLAACGLREPILPTQVAATPPVVRVTADEIAQAMQADEFYAKYGNTTLLVEGTVYSVTQVNGDMVVALNTTVPMKVLCHLGNQVPKVQVGDAITVESADPERDRATLALWSCHLP